MAVRVGYNFVLSFFTAFEQQTRPVSVQCRIICMWFGPFSAYTHTPM